MRDPANNLEDRHWIEGRRCLWNGQEWSVFDYTPHNVLRSVRAIVPMEKLETECVHISYVSFDWTDDDL